MTTGKLGDIVDPKGVPRYEAWGQADGTVKVLPDDGSGNNVYGCLDNLKDSIAGDWSFKPSPGTESAKDSLGILTFTPEHAQALAAFAVEQSMTRPLTRAERTTIGNALHTAACQYAKYAADMRGQAEDAAKAVEIASQDEDMVLIGRSPKAYMKLASQFDRQEREANELAAMLAGMEEITIRKGDG